MALNAPQRIQFCLTKTFQRLADKLQIAIPVTKVRLKMLIKSCRQKDNLILATCTNECTEITAETQSS